MDRSIQRKDNATRKRQLSTLIFVGRNLKKRCETVKVFFYVFDFLPSFSYPRKSPQILYSESKAQALSVLLGYETKTTKTVSQENQLWSSPQGTCKFFHPPCKQRLKCRYLLKLSCNYYHPKEHFRTLASKEVDKVPKKKTKKKKKKNRRNPSSNNNTKQLRSLTDPINGRHNFACVLSTHPSLENLNSNEGMRLIHPISFPSVLRDFIYDEVYQTRRHLPVWQSKRYRLL